MEISIHALNGSLGYRTLRVTGYHAKRPLHILVDVRSSHNFINPDVVKLLGCTTRETPPQIVAAAIGNGIKVDKACQISWLLQGTEFIAEFLLLPLPFGFLWSGIWSTRAPNTRRYEDEFKEVNPGIHVKREEACFERIGKTTGNIKRWKN